MRQPVAEKIQQASAKDEIQEELEDLHINVQTNADGV
jgi:hypothetical protein